jgi:hypothetical protein
MRNSNKVKQSQQQNIIINTAPIRKRRRNKKKQQRASVSFPTSVIQYRYLPQQLHQQQPQQPPQPPANDNRLATLENSLVRLQEHLKESGKSVHQAVNLQQTPFIPKSVVKFPSYTPFNSPPPTYGEGGDSSMYYTGMEQPSMTSTAKSSRRIRLHIPREDTEDESPAPEPTPSKKSLRSRLRIPEPIPPDVNTEDEHAKAEPVSMDIADISPVKARKQYEKSDPYPRRNHKWFDTIDPEERDKIYQWKNVRAEKRPDYRTAGLKTPPFFPLPQINYEKG